MGDAIERESRFGIETGTLYEADQFVLWLQTDKPGRACPWDLGDLAQYVMVIVPDDDLGVHAGQAWMLPAASLPMPDFDAASDISLDQQAIDDAAARAFVSSDFVDTATTARYYLPSVQLTEEIAPLFEKVARLDRCRAVAPGEFLADDARVINLSLFFGHGGMTVGANTGIVAEVLPEG